MSSLSPVQAASPSKAVVRSVANCEGVDPLELPPLYETIDPEALDALVETDGKNESTIQIGFTYSGYGVTVTGDGTVNVDEEPSSS